MNYSEMTDFEINCEVAGALNMPPWPRYGYAGTQPEPYTAAICHGGGRLGGFDPCNSWADVGEIIQSNYLSIECDDMFDVPLPSSYWTAHNPAGNHYTDENPLRAAMIVFLMMQEDK